ncbi:MAG: helix-hairpin-helix domain-containing protein [Polaromonas sp.]
MFKKLLAFLAAMSLFAAFAAVDVNKATVADLDGLKGIGPGISTRILDERKKGDFKDWNDFIGRVQGIGEKNAAKFSTEGMTIGGASYKGAAPAVKKDVKPAAAKADEKKAEAKPAAAVTVKDEKKAKAEEAKAKADPKKTASDAKAVAAKN